MGSGQHTKQHIAIVFHDFNAGGTEATALRLAGEWLANGRDVTIIAGAADGPMRARVPEGARVELLDPPVARSHLSRLRLGQAMVPALEQVAPDVVFIPGNYHFILAHAIRRHFPSLPIAAKVSNPLLPPLPAAIRRIASSIIGALLKPIDRLVFMSEALLASDGDVIGAKPTTVLPEPNLPDDFTAPPRSSPTEPPLIIAIGRMEPQKNFALAIKAFALLVKQRPARLLILGEGYQRPLLTALVQRLRLDGLVDMPGYHPNVGAKLAEASLLLMTSRYEGYPAVMVEALAADVPVVSTDCSPSQRELISTEMHGKVVDAATPELLAEAMVAVLNGPFSSGGARAIGLDGNRIGHSASRYLAMFDSIVR